MRVTAQSDYALRALIEIARRAVDGPLVSIYGLRPEAVQYNESAAVLQHVDRESTLAARRPRERHGRPAGDGQAPARGQQPDVGRDAWQSH